MPNLNDHSIDLSNVATSLAPAVPSGLTTFALLGKSLQASLYNYANPAAPLLTSSQGFALPLITAGVSGLTVNGGGGSTEVGGQVILPDTPSTGSETIFFVASINPTNWASFVAEALGIWNGTAGTLNQSCYSVAQAATTGISFNCGYLNGATATSANLSGVCVTPGALSTTTAEQAIISTPQLYKFKFDIPNLLATFQNVTQASIVGAPVGTTKTAVLPAGATRPVIGNFQMLGNIQSPLNISVTHHAYLHYNRATTAAEDAAIYSQLKTIMATRGVTI